MTKRPKSSVSDIEKKIIRTEESLKFCEIAISFLTHEKERRDKHYDDECFTWLDELHTGIREFATENEKNISLFKYMIDIPSTLRWNKQELKDCKELIKDYKKELKEIQEWEKAHVQVWTSHALTDVGLKEIEPEDLIGLDDLSDVIEVTCYKKDIDGVIPIKKLFKRS